MNTRKLENLAKFMEKLPKKQFDIKSWASNNGNGKKDYDDYDPIDKRTFDIPKCNSTCCIAGWDIMRLGKRLDRSGGVYDKSGTYLGFAEYVSSEHLELTEDEAKKLFYYDRWPVNQKTGKPMFANTPKGAAKRIRYLIKTGE